MPAAFPVRILFFALAMGMAGCVSHQSKPQDPEPMDAPVDMNQAKSDPAGENLFTRTYISRNLPAASLQHDADGPKVYRGEDQVDDNQRLLENGYDMLGYSEFIAGSDMSPDLVLQQAKSVNADLALVYVKLAGEVPLSVKLQQRRDQSKNSDGSTSATPTQKSYNYFTTYWAKLVPPLLGVHVMSPSEDEASSGVRVIAVINDSPAAKAGLHDGDILTQMGDVPLKNPENLTDATRFYAGREVELQLLRGQNTTRIPVQLNPSRSSASK